MGERVELSGKVALVTGSSRGIGREIARELAKKGVRVAVHYRTDREAAQETLASLEGGAHAAFAADVADAGSTRSLVEGVAREMGGIDVLVNNAAIFESHPVPEVDFAGWQDAWTRTIATNLMGPAILAPPCATAKPDDQDSEKKAPIHRSAQDGMFRRDGTSEPVSLPRMSGLFPLTPPLPPPL
jgi:NAD(P)-dependent dehydrogenase (short-subunit alcohol dehydrogenase family)